MKHLQISTLSTTARSQELTRIAGLVIEFTAAARSEGTRKAYAAQWRGFMLWCQRNGLHPIPAAPETVAMYLSDKAAEGRSVATIGLALTAISEAHRIAGHESPRLTPIVRQIWKGIRRELTVAQKQAKPVTVDLLRKMIETLPDELRGRRDRALLCLGFAGAFRRSELVALIVEDLSFTDDGLVVMIRKSKTDQEGEGAAVGIPYGSYPATCPVRSVKSWIKEAGICEGRVFRSIDRSIKIGDTLSDKVVTRVVKRAVQAAGFDPADYSGHSLRSGLATQAARSGKSDRAIMRHGRWKSRSMVARYVREGTLFEASAACCGIGL